MVRKVVDQNHLREPNPELHRYLRAGNAVVLTDYVAMETHKGKALLNLIRSLEIISKYPGQVVVLQNTPHVIQLTRNGPAGLPDGLIHVEQTRDFPLYCDQLYKINPNKLSQPLADNEKRSREANEFFRDRLSNAQKIIQAIEMLARELHPDHMKTLRTGAQWGTDLLSIIMKHVVYVTSRQMSQLDFDIPDPTIAKYNYLFRYALASYLLTVRWLSRGGYENIPLERFQNDMIDMTHVAYATYFDGVLSRDNKVNEIYALATAFLGAL